jgi:hypothetical protein
VARRVFSGLWCLNDLLDVGFSLSSSLELLLLLASISLRFMIFFGLRGDIVSKENRGDFGSMESDLSRIVTCFEFRGDFVSAESSGLSARLATTGNPSGVTEIVLRIVLGD